MTPTTQDANLTLRQAIERLRREEDPDGAVTEGMSETSAHAFNMHDAVHLIFGCGTSLRGEIAAHAWMAFVTTAPVGEMHRAVANQEHRRTLAGIGHGKLFGTWLTMLPRLCGILWKAGRMQKKVDFHGLDDLMEKTIGQIRAEHGVRI